MGGRGVVKYIMSGDNGGSGGLGGGGLLELRARDRLAIAARRVSLSSALVVVRSVRCNAIPMGTHSATNRAQTHSLQKGNRSSVSGWTLLTGTGW